MIRPGPPAALLVALLLVLTPLCAGCLSVPGPEDAKKTPVITTVKTTLPAERTTAARTPVVRHTTSPAATTGPETIPPVTAAATALDGTCAHQGGAVMQAGYQCTGTWLTASDSFSCCSEIALRKTPDMSGQSATVIPSSFSLSVNLDDTLGSITP